MCVVRQYEIVQLLGSYGADVNLKDTSGSTPYDVACMIGEGFTLNSAHLRRNLFVLYMRCLHCVGVQWV